MNDNTINHSNEPNQTGSDHPDRPRLAAGDDQSSVPVLADEHRTGGTGRDASVELTTTHTAGPSTGYSSGHSTDKSTGRVGDRVPRLTPERIRTAVMIVAALLAIALTVATLSDRHPTPAPPGTASDAGSTTGASGESRKDRGEDRKPEQATGTLARAAQRLDQPIPVPGYRWRGWARYPEGRCAWMPPALRERLALAEPPVPHETYCALTLREGDQVHVTWGRPTTPTVWDPTGQRHRSTVAGLASRTGRFPLFLQLALRGFPSMCRVTVNTRSLTGLSVLAYNDNRHQPRCETARDVATLIVRSMIPAVGGTPWTDTPQHPAPATFTNRSVCDLLDGNLAGFGGHQDGPPRVRTDELGETCTYAAGDTSVSALLTTGPHHGLAQVRPLRLHATARLLGTLPAREERLGDTGCALTVEIAPGRVARITYRSRTRPEDPCGAADVIAARTVQALLDRTAP